MVNSRRTGTVLVLCSGISTAPWGHRYLLTEWMVCPVGWRAVLLIFLSSSKPTFSALLCVSGGWLSWTSSLELPGLLAFCWIWPVGGTNRRLRGSRGGRLGPLDPCSSLLGLSCFGNGSAPWSRSHSSCQEASLPQQQIVLRRSNSFFPLLLQAQRR